MGNIYLEILPKSRNMKKNHSSIILKQKDTQWQVLDPSSSAVTQMNKLPATFEPAWGNISKPKQP